MRGGRGVFVVGDRGRGRCWLPLRLVGWVEPGAALEGRGRGRRRRSLRQFGRGVGGAEQRRRPAASGAAMSRPCPARRETSAVPCAGEQRLVLVAQVAAHPMIEVAAARMLILLVDELR